MKQFFRFSILLLALLLPALATAHDFEVDGIYYNINGNEATVTFRSRNYPYYPFSGGYAGSVVIPATVTYNGTTYPVTSIGDNAFCNCWRLTDVYCYIADLSNVSNGNRTFYSNSYGYSGRTLHVLQGTADVYQADENWYPYFGQIVEDIFIGDVNRDFEVNISDVNAVINMILSGNTSSIAADVNGDGEINISDINALIDIILN